MMSEEKQQCRKCKKVYDLNEFHKRKISKNGHNNVCKICANEYSRKKHHENKHLKKITDHQRELNRKNYTAYRKRQIEKDPEAWYKKQREYQYQYRLRWFQKKLKNVTS